MTKPRVGFSATRLSNGKVLAAGGATDTEVATNTAEIYDPATGTWSSHWLDEAGSPAAFRHLTPRRDGIS